MAVLSGAHRPNSLAAIRECFEAGVGRIEIDVHSLAGPDYVVFHDRTLAEIAERQCKDWADLAAVSGVGPAKLERYADEVLAVVAAG